MNSHKTLETTVKSDGSSTSKIMGQLTYRINNVVGVYGGNKFKLLNTLDANHSEKLNKQTGLKMMGKAVLGKGANGKVGIARYKKKNKSYYVAVKKIKSQDSITHFESMLNFYTKLSGSNLEGVMLPLDIIKQKDKKNRNAIFQFFPIINLGDGEKLISYMHVATAEVRILIAMHVAFSLLSSFKKLHDKNIFHIDFTLYNFLIDSLGKIFISDFDSGIFEEQGFFYCAASTLPVNRQYSPPESFYSIQEKAELKPRQILAANDAWRLGLVLAMLVSPLSHSVCNEILELNEKAAIAKSYNGLNHEYFHSYYLPSLKIILEKLFYFLDRFPEELVLVIKGLLSIDAHIRMTTEEAFNIISQSAYLKPNGEIVKLLHILINSPLPAQQTFSVEQSKPTYSNDLIERLSGFLRETDQDTIANVTKRHDVSEASIYVWQKKI